MEPMSPQEQFNYRWPLPHVAGSPDLGVLSVSLTSTRSSDPSHLFGLAGPTGLPEPDGSPLFTPISLIACWRYEPREQLRPLAIARAAIPPSPLRDRVGYSDHDRFRGYVPVHCRSGLQPLSRDRKSTRLNSSHPSISYAVFCLKQKNKTQYH